MALLFQRRAGDAMTELRRTVDVMEADYHRTLPPKLVVEYCMGAVVREMQRAGGDRDRLYAFCGAVWMASHVRFYQSFPLLPGDELLLRANPRVIEVDVTRGGESAVTFDCSFIPVDKLARRVLRLQAVEPMWKTPARKAVSRELFRMRDVSGFEPCGGDTVRMSDCDCNHHLTSGAYLSLVCNALGFWDGPPERYMQMMQIDFASEVRPGTRLSFFRSEAEGARFVRGVKPDGKIAFTAKCVFD